MKRIKLKKEVKVGIFSLTMILALYWAINFIKGTDLFRGTTTYYAAYDRVNGLQASSQIVIKGYKVGVVRKMHFDPAASGKIVLELGIKSRFRIPQNSRARIFSDGLMGGKAIEIELGDAPQYLHDGDTIRSEWDGGLLEMAGSEFEALKIKATAMTNKIDAVLDNLNGLLEDNADNLTVTLGNIARMSASLETVVTSESGDLKSIVDNLNSLSHTLSNSGPRLERTMSNLESFTGYLNSAQVAGAVDNLSSSLAALNAVLEKVNRGEGTAGKLMQDEALYDSLTAASSNLSSLLEDLKANPKRYVHFSLFGRGDKEK